MYSIGEISKIVNISIDALRYYDEIRLLKPCHIDKSSRYRYYSEDQVKDLIFIVELKRYGFTLDAIKELLQCRDTSRLKAAYNMRIKQLSEELAHIEESMQLLRMQIIKLENRSEEMMEAKTVLLADDSVFLRTVMKNLLEEHGFRVIEEAENGNEAIEKYRKANPDIVIMDIAMPELDGISAVKGIKAQNEESIVVMCSAKGCLQNVLESIKAGASDFVVKPFQPECIITALEKSIRNGINYNANTIESLQRNENFLKKCEGGIAVSQETIHSLLDLCKGEYIYNSIEIQEFLTNGITFAKDA